MGIIMKSSDRIRLIIVVLLVVGIGALHYFTDVGAHHFHVFYRSLYFVPIILAGFWFSLPGVLAVSLSISLLYLPLLYAFWGGFSADDLDKILVLILYNAAAVIVGSLKERERTRQEQLRQKDRLAAMGKAVSCVAHDMKTPLIAIGGFARLVQNHIDRKSSDFDKLNIIISETGRLERMVKDMLDFSQPLVLQKKPEDISDLVCECLGIVAPLAQKKGISLRKETAADLPALFVDGDRLKQVFINLLINAIEASPENGVVVVETYQDKRNLVVAISDSGPGLQVPECGDIFTPFFSTKKQGTGLGLAIVKKIVEAHQGRLEVVDNSPQGLTLRTSLPLPS